MGIVHAFAAQRGMKFTRYDPELHDAAIFRTANDWCGGLISESYIQSRLMQIRDEMDYVGADAAEQGIIAAWRKALTATGEYNVLDPRTQHGKMQAWVLYYLNQAQKAVIPTAEVVGLVIWHDVNLTHDWHFCKAVPAPPPQALTQAWQPTFFPDWDLEVFQDVPAHMRAGLFNDPRSTVQIAVACAEHTVEYTSMDLTPLALAFALASNNMQATKHSALLTLPLTDRKAVTGMLDRFGFGAVRVRTPAGQDWYFDGAPAGTCEALNVYGKFGKLAVDSKTDDERWFLLTPVEAAILLDLTKVETRGVACVQPGSIAAQIGVDPRTGRRAYTNDSNICQSGQFGFVAAQNIDRAMASLGSPGFPPEAAVEDLLKGAVLPPSTQARRRRSFV